MFYLVIQASRKYTLRCLYSPRYREHSYCFSLPVSLGDAWLLGGLLLIQLLLSATWVASDFFQAKVSTPLRCITCARRRRVSRLQVSGILALTVLLTVGTFVSVWVLLRYLGSKAGSTTARGMVVAGDARHRDLHPTVNGFGHV